MTYKMNLRATALALLGASVLLSGPARADKPGLELATAKGCFVCHALEPDSRVPVPLAPAYTDIARRYRGDETALSRLVERVVNGTRDAEQAWGDKVNMRFMPPNVNVSRVEAQELVEWILTLEPASPVSRHLAQHEEMLALASYSGCFTCHALTRDPAVPVPLAPALRDVAARYRGKPGAAERLLDSVTKGTLDKPQAWSDQVNMMFMPANVALREGDARALVDWILALEPASAAPR